MFRNLQGISVIPPTLFSLFFFRQKKNPNNYTRSESARLGTEMWNMVPPSKRETRLSCPDPASATCQIQNEQMPELPPCNNCSYKYFLPSYGAALPNLLSQPLQERSARQLVLWFTSRHWTRLTCLKQLLVLKESSQIALGPCATGNTTTTACRPYSVRADLQNLDVADIVFIHLSRNGPSYCCSGSV